MQWVVEVYPMSIGDSCIVVEPEILELKEGRVEAEERVTSSKRRTDIP